MSNLKLTEASVKALALPGLGQKLIYDATLRGFGIRLNTNSKCFFAERRLNGKTKRITIGPYPIVPVATARMMAQVFAGRGEQPRD